jgi:PAS domain S-box-containing protein
VKIINSVPDFIFAKDTNLRVIICNEAYASAVGKKPEEMIGHTDIENGWDTELVCGNPVKGIRGFENDDRDALSGKTIHNPYDLANTPKGVLIFDTYKMPLHGKDGEIIGMLGIARDITERKKVEENLTILNQKNKLILLAAAEGILGLDLHGNHIFVNPAAAKMLGYAAEELIGRPSHSTWHHTKPDGNPYPREECQVYASFLDGAVHRSSLEVFWRKDGTSFPVEYASMPIYERKRLVGTVVTFADITERKKAEETQKQLVATIEATPDFVGFADAKDKHLIYVNKAGRKMCGIGNDEDVAKLNISDVHPEWANKILTEEILPVAVRDGVWTGECAFLNIRDRHEIPVLMVLSSHKASNGEVEVFSTISRDITERKKAEKMLRESEERYKNLFKANVDGMLVADVATKKFRYANPAICRMLGYSEEEFTRMGVADIHPKESLERVLAEFEAQASGAKITAKGLPCVRKDGRVISVSISTVPVMIDQTKYLLGIFRDSAECRNKGKQDVS